MSLFPRLVHPIPATRRAYSSFFSSKPGGGRYFNSAKPPKSVVASHGVKKGNSDTNVSSHPGDATDGAQGNNGAQGNSGHKKYKMKDESSLSSPHGQTPLSPATNSLATSINTESSPTSSHPSPNSTPSPAVTQRPTQPSHPTLNPQDYKLHQFFSLHRPLLLLSQPSSIIFEAPPPPRNSLFSQEASSTEHAPPPPLHLGTLDDPPEASPESDADAARQLGRALVMSRVGTTVSWENTLRRLGLDVELELGRAELKQEMEREWVEVMLDSTKRKRRKKMKKHKYVPDLIITSSRAFRMLRVFRCLNLS
jgi:hypothetical protein